MFIYLEYVTLAATNKKILDKTGRYSKFILKNCTWTRWLKTGFMN